MGVWIFNPMIEDYFGGNTAADVVNLNVDGIANNGLKPNGLAKNDKEYNNALKFVNALRNTGDNNCIENLNYQNEERIQFCIGKLGIDEMNYSLNDTRNTFDGIVKDFSGSMDFDEEGSTSPTTFPTSIQIYDTNGYMVAVGNLSTPIKKDYNAELIIKVVVPG
jgi:hypothetical protein